ncbi:MAG: cyclodeaminase/cyclohydrolase family protein [Clostridium sp.]|jgi:formiminotetrahydrofolate cyclodeaminase|nr:cyclodeaminase/cyclohydrolase family protein [Clostridium sp.]
MSINTNETSNNTFGSMQIQAFIDRLASKDAVPGGGGAAALMGAVGTALGNMVASLTIGKKKYAPVQEEVLLLQEKADKIQADFIALMDLDAKVFLPLSAAYGLPKETKEQQDYKDMVMAEALQEAALVPLRIIETCGEALEVIDRISQIGSVLALSDAGCATACVEAAIRSAALNVYINTKSMKDRALADTINQQVANYLSDFLPLSNQIYTRVKDRFTI